MATKERTQLGFFQQKELEALLMEIGTNNSVGKGQTLPTSHLSAGSAFRDREVRRRAYTHTHTHTHTLLPKSILPTISHGASWPGIPALGVTSLDHSAEVSALCPEGLIRSQTSRRAIDAKGRHVGKWQ